jgi:Uma2 family endonuclease
MATTLKTPAQYIGHYEGVVIFQDKMRWYIKDGIDLGWLIYPDKRETMIYTKGRPSTLANTNKLRGIGPVKGFTLDLRPIWKGLRQEGE